MLNPLGPSDPAKLLPSSLFSLKTVTAWPTGVTDWVRWQTGERLRPMRYEPSQRLFRLARSLAASRTGLTLDEMAAELEVGRRTTERLRDSLADIFPQLECWDDEEKMRRWRLPGSALIGVVEPRPEALAAIETSARELAMRGETE
jgi:hypothetical protein